MRSSGERNSQCIICTDPAADKDVHSAGCRSLLGRIDLSSIGRTSASGRVRILATNGCRGQRAAATVRYS